MIKDNLTEIVEQLFKKEITFEEAGKWLNENGNAILNELDWLREMLEK